MKRINIVLAKSTMKVSNQAVPVDVKVSILLNTTRLLIKNVTPIACVT